MATPEYAKCPKCKKPTVDDASFCAYCGKRFSGEGPYCSERCRKQGEAAARLAYKTRIPFWIFTVAAAVLALTGGAMLLAL